MSPARCRIALQQMCCASIKFFRAQRDALMNMAEVHNPRIVLLTPGPHNETYFEHSYIARYLGFTLVEGADTNGARSAACSKDSGWAGEGEM